jgi:hypothetical protein
MSDVPTPVRLSRPDAGPTSDQHLWTLIRNRTDAIAYNNFHNFADAVFGNQPPPDPADDTPELAALRAQARQFTLVSAGVDAYQILRVAAQYFLMHEVGLIVDSVVDGAVVETPDDAYDPVDEEGEFFRRNLSPLPGDWVSRLRDDYYVQLQKLAGADPQVLPYMGRILQRLRNLEPKGPDDGAGGCGCYGVLPGRVTGPLALELIWTYWHEEGMLNQAFNAISNRFQNRRLPGQSVDPLARLEIDPLRPLNNLIWGWLQSEPFRLSVRRRAFEYDHHYGLTLLGKAVGPVRGADSRSQFIEAFHNLLHLCTIFFLQDDDLTVDADGFPLLNALKETQLVLTEGQHNQFGDLPWTSRVEDWTQMYMLGRPEMREFLGGRVMVPYREPWMDRVDVVKSLMNWTDTNVTHFRDLGTFGEQLLLTVRYGLWTDTIEPAQAKNWARYWRSEIQGYIHAYRAATGVDLRQSADATMPGILLQRRLEVGAAAAPTRAFPPQGRPVAVEPGRANARIPLSGPRRELPAQTE